MRKIVLSLLVTLVFAGISEIHAEKIIKVVVCGNLTGYYVEEQHNYSGEWPIHTLSCSPGENNPCKWAHDPNSIVNFHNCVPSGLTFQDDAGNVVPVYHDALNNAINSSIDNGYNSATIKVNNIMLTYSISQVANKPGYNQIIITLWVTND